MPRYTISDITERIGGTLDGDGSIEIDGLETLGNAHATHLTFVGDQKYAKLWSDSKASAVIATNQIELPSRDDSCAVIRVSDADQAMIVLLELFVEEAALPPIGVHETSAIDESARIGKDVRIGPHCQVGRDCVIDDGAVLFGNVTIHPKVTIGSGTRIHAGVSINQGCSVGSNSLLHANAVIGSDGFGFRPSQDGKMLLKIPHIGAVQIGDGVEIGACTCIDRGKFGSTRIGDGTKIDNLCQIGHNCEIGRNCVLCGQVGVAGSTTIGDGTQIGGAVGIADHLVIGSGVSIGAHAGVMNDIPDGETWVGTPAGERSRVLREHTAIRRLADWSKTLRRLARQQAAETTNE